MKTGRTLPDLLKEILRQQESKRDFIAATDHVSLVPEMHYPDGGSTRQVTTSNMLMQIGDSGDAHNLTVGINDHAHNQIGTHTKIPAQYYDRMRTQDPNLLAINVNAWFRKDPFLAHDSHAGRQGQRFLV